MDLAELWTNANKAFDDLLSTKGSIDTRRQRVVWDLGMMLHQNESQVAVTVKEARVICSQMALDIWIVCSQSILEARTSYLVAVKEAKTTRSCLLQETEATCSKAICEAEAWKISQAAMLHKEHSKYMWDLEEQAMGEESRRRNNFLTACQVILYSSPPLLKSALAASYHILLGQTPLLPPLISPQRTSPVEEQPTTTVSPTLVLKQSLRPKRWHPLPDPMESTLIGGATPKATLGGPPSPQEVRDPTLGHNTQTQPYRGVQPRLQYGKGGQKRILLQAILQLHLQWHSWPFWDIEASGYKSWPSRHFYLWNSITLDWARRAKASKLHFVILTQGFEVSLGSTPSESPKVMELMGIHDPDALCQFGSVTYCPWCGKEGQNEGMVVNHLWTTHYWLGLVCDRCYSCLSTTSDTLCHHGWLNCHWLRESIPSK